MGEDSSRRKTGRRALFALVVAMPLGALAAAWVAKVRDDADRNH
jgi:hypothetical protein